MINGFSMDHYVGDNPNKEEKRYESIKEKYLKEDKNVNIKQNSK